MSNLRQRNSAQVVAPTFDESSENSLSPALTGLFAIICGATIANVYYAQSLVGPIAASLHLPANWAGIIVTITQIGFGAGLFFVVCLGDLLENRRLILVTTGGTIAGLIGIILSTSAPLFFVSSFILGVSSVGVQILLPLVSHLAPAKMRGRVIGNVMGGLIAGIMLSRPIASLLTAHFGWRAVFVVSGGVMLVILALLFRFLPRRQPTPGIGYAALLASLLHLLATSRPLQRRAAYQGAMFAVFNLFWTGAPLMLHDRLGFGQDSIAYFALAGAGGVLIAPVVGRAADRGYAAAATGAALLSAIISLFITGWAVAVGAILLLTAATIVLDAGVQANHIAGQRIVYSLSSEARSRLNAAYMTVVFLCGALGSALGSLTYFSGGWWLTVAVGAGIATLALALFATEYPQASA
jgi:predicted MFS family arabinose efflux permease